MVEFSVIRIRIISDSSASACYTAGPSSNPPGRHPEGGPLLSGEQ
jgi:hypothetical protein